MKFDYQAFTEQTSEPIEETTIVVTEYIKEIIGNVSAKYLPDGWHYQVVNGEHKTLCNENGYPSTWDKPKSRREVLALMIDKNPTLEYMMSELDLQLL